MKTAINFTFMRKRQRSLILSLLWFFLSLSLTLIPTQLKAEVSEGNFLANIADSSASQSWVANVEENTFMAKAEISWINLVREQAKRGQWQEVIETWQKAVDSFESQGDRLNQSMALTNLSLSYQQLGQWDAAQQAIDQSLQLLETQTPSLEQQRLLANTLEIQGQLYLNVGHPEMALGVWPKAISLYQNLNQPQRILRTQINQANAMQQLGLYPKACQTLIDALTLDSGICQPKNDLSLRVRENLAQRLQAEQSESEFLSLYSLGLVSLGNVLTSQGNLETALEVLLTSGKIAKTLDNPEQLAVVFLNLGNVAQGLVNLTQPEKPSPLTNNCPIFFNQQETQGKFYEQLADCMDKIESPRQENNFKFYADLADFSYQQAQKTSNPDQVFQAQLNRLQLLLKTGQASSEEIERLLDSLLQQRQKLGFSHQTLYSELQLAQTLMCLRFTRENRFIDRSSPLLRQCHINWEQYLATLPIPQTQTIEKIITSVVEQAKTDSQLQDNKAITYGLGYLGAFNQQLNNLSEAETLTLEALQQISAFESPEIAYFWHWQLGKIYTLQGKIDRGIQSYDIAFQLLQSLRQDLAGSNTDIQFNFRDSVEPIYRELTDLLLRTDQRTQANKDNQPPAINPSQENLRKARNIIEALQLAELDDFFKEPCLAVQPTEIDRLVDESPEPVAVIYAIILDQSLEIILKVPQQQELKYYSTTVPQTEVKKVLTDLQQYLKLSGETTNVKRLSQKVYQWLIDPLEKELQANNVKHLVFVLDGLLRNIPMSVLYDAKNNQYLIENYGVALVPGLQLLPSILAQEESLNALVAGISEKRVIEGIPFSSLINVEVELDQLESLLPENQKLINQNLTKDNLKNLLNENDFSVLHLATHAQFSSNADDIFILLYDQLLNLEEVEDLLSQNKRNNQTTLDLLVLSACETATGGDRSVLGLAGVAVKSGVRSTLATLWPVLDNTTANFMTSFYQKLEEPNMTKIKAVQLAQQEMLQDVSNQRPNIWSAYTLIGNWL